MYSYEEIRTVHLEITQRCQAACPMCDRNENGGPINKHIIPLSELSLEDCKAIFQPDFIQQLNTMYMCGNLGDPMVAHDTLPVFQYFREHNPTMWLSMNTNGGAKSSTWWKDIASTYGRMGAVIFSVDGLKDTNHIYRQNVIWERVEANMRTFIEAGGRARWDFIVFQHNEHQIDEAKALATQWGVERFQVKKSGRFITQKSKPKEQHQAQNRKGEKTSLIEKPTKTENQNLALLKQKSIEKQFGSMQEYYDTCQIACKVVPDKNIFITAEGILMPCCWTAGRMYKWWNDNYRVEQIWDFIDDAGGKDALNTIKYGLKTTMERSLLNSIEQSWSINGIKNGRLGVCAMKCGTKFDPFKEQFT